MANNKDGQKKETQPIKPDHTLGSEQPRPKGKNPNPPTKKFPLSIVSIFIAIAAILLALWTSHNNYQSQKKFEEEQRDLMGVFEELKQQQKQTDTQTHSMTQSQSTLQNKLEALNKQLQAAMNQQLYQNQDWLLLKARYFLELAQINAHWTDNYSATISLLQQADKLLAPLSSQHLFEVRQAIAKEIVQLKTIPVIDLAGLLSQLDAAQASVDDLTLETAVNKNKLSEESPVENSASKNANNATWKTHLQNSLNLLEKMVIVRREDENIKPLMSPLYESMLKESIRLSLQEAQWATLNNKPVVYQLALKQAISNIKRTFSKSAPPTTALLKQLEDLQQATLAQKKPEVESALTLLNQIIDNKELLTKPTNDSSHGVN